MLFRCNDSVAVISVKLSHGRYIYIYMYMYTFSIRDFNHVFGLRNYGVWKGSLVEYNDKLRYCNFCFFTFSCFIKKCLRVVKGLFFFVKIFIIVIICGVKCDFWYLYIFFFMNNEFLYQFHGCFFSIFSFEMWNFTFRI